MATIAYSSRCGYAVPPETAQAFSGLAQMIPLEVDVDTDSIDNGAGTLTLPVTGIYTINFQVFPEGAGSDCTTFIYLNGSSIAEGLNRNDSGTTIASSTCEFTGCFNAGDEITFWADAFSVERPYCTFTLFRVPSPFTILKLDVGPVNDFIDWQPVCDIPAWWNAAEPTKVMVPTTGYYYLSVKTRTHEFPLNPWRDNQVWVNGSYFDTDVANPGPDNNIPLSTVMSLTAGDYVEVYNLCQSGTQFGLNTAELMMFEVPGTLVGAHLYKSTQGWVDNNWHPVTFNSALWDTDGFWAGGTSEYLTVPAGKAGTYLIWTGGWGDPLRAMLFELRDGGSGVGALLQEIATGIDVWGFHHRGSPTGYMIRNMSVGDQFYMRMLNGDGPEASFPMNDLHMGMMLIDGWDYPVQNDCPCPSGFLPQIYRWLKK